jgi:uncharacterized glyoxalase superfamily protein PhnB
MSEQAQATQTMFSCLCYRDAHAAMDWLEAALGFERKAVYPDERGTVVHAELVLDGAIVMCSELREGEDALGQPPGGSSIYVVVRDPDERHARAVAAGAEIARGLRDEDYGSRGFTARDPEGNFWSLGTYQP